MGFFFNDKYDKNGNPTPQGAVNSALFRTFAETDLDYLMKCYAPKFVSVLNAISDRTWNIDKNFNELKESVDELKQLAISQNEILKKMEERLNALEAEKAKPESSHEL